VSASPDPAVHDPAAPRAPGRPRDPDLDRAILAATRELLAEEGFARLSIEGVAQRAGVGKPTIYRRWSSKVALVLEAIDQSGPSTSLDDPSRSVRERLTALLTELGATLGEGPAGRIMAGLVGEIPRDPELAAAIRRVFVARRRRKVFRLLREGIDAGELRSDLDLDVAADQLTGPFIVRTLLTGGPMGPSFVVTLVDHLFAGWAAPVS